MDTSTAVGSVYITACALGIALNCLTVHSIISQKKHQQNFASMYILFMQPLITDIIFDLIYMCYHAPSILIQDHLIAGPLGRQVSTFVDAAQSYCWSCNSLSHVSLAANRFVVIVLHRIDFFTTSRTILVSVFQQILALSIAVAVHFALPCCRRVVVDIEFSFSNFGYREVTLPGVPNYVFTYVTMPVKIGSATIPIVLYCSILIIAHAMTRRFKLHSPERRRRRHQELRFAAQFASIALVYTFSSFSFTFLNTIYPAINSNSKWTNGIPVVLGLLNSASNAIVYLLNEAGFLNFEFVQKKKPGLMSVYAKSKRMGARVLAAVRDSIYKGHSSGPSTAQSP